MPRKSPIGEILRLAERFGYVAVVFYVRLWDCGNDGSLWVHPSAVINIPSGSGSTNTNIQTTDGEVVPINVSRYV